MQVRVNLRELILYHVGFEIDEFVFNITRGEKGPQPVFEVGEQWAVRVVGVFISEGGLGVGEGLVQIDFVL